jgi:hypothetical protein
MTSGRWILLLAITVGASACYKEHEYLSDFAEAYCGWLERCEHLETIGYDSVDDCVEERLLKNEQDIESFGVVCEEYDPKAGKECIEGLDAQECVDLTAVYPEVCQAACTDPNEG